MKKVKYGCYIEETKTESGKRVLYFKHIVQKYNKIYKVQMPKVTQKYASLCGVNHKTKKNTKCGRPQK